MVVVLCGVVGTEGMRVQLRMRWWKRGGCWVGGVGTVVVVRDGSGKLVCCGVWGRGVAVMVLVSVG